MKNVFIAFALGALLTMPCVLRAEEVVIPLFEVISMTPLQGENPLDDPEQSNPTPPRPTDFRATINGNAFAITRQNSNIPSAQAIVVNASAGNIVVNSNFTESLQQQIPNAGVYVLNIQTANGALTGQFMVQ
ncbi:MAG: T9SS type A sorting domain-containing protein [Paludibacteraceae bacterium]|nr:T9SS type A sorting domain-containing protein [Paludibacteraceae bacterium]